jgi:hypothetical protein
MVILEELLFLMGVVIAWEVILALRLVWPIATEFLEVQHLPIIVVTVLEVIQVFQLA